MISDTAYVFTSDFCLLGQVEVLQEEALLRQRDANNDSLVVTGIQHQIRPLLKQSSSHEHIISAAQVNSQFKYDGSSFVLHTATPMLLTEPGLNHKISVLRVRAAL